MRPPNADHLATETVREAALAHGVCTRPILRRLVDTTTGAEQVVPIPCGSTRERLCPPCAERNRKLRMQQCREGWHRTEEPPDDTEDHAEDDDDPEATDDPEDAAGGSSRRVRSTRRRQDTPDLPRLPVAHHTLGRTFTGNGGRVYRPSMFLTLTLPSYGPVRADGTPVDPGTYDYRRAGLDAMHFAKLVDRFWQNLRRAVGYQVQYFATVEAQKRLAFHLHAAVRGVFPRALGHQVVAATYHQLWWPPIGDPVYPDPDRLPVWDTEHLAYVDPDTCSRLPTFEEALDRLDADPAAQPAHVLRFGSQTDLQGLIGGTKTADRRVGYLTKYLTKSIAETHGPEDDLTGRQRAHIDRLHQQVRWLPCSPGCANWLRHGVQPCDAEPGLVPGQCPGKAHRRENLGCGGRRVLVSRRWTGKTLEDHRADRRTVVAEVLDAAGVEVPDAHRCSATTTTDHGAPRYHWEPLDPTQTQLPTYREAILAAIRERERWRAQYEAAKRVAAAAGAGQPGRGDHPPASSPDNPPTPGRRAGSPG